METPTAALAVLAIDGGQSAEALERGVRGAALPPDGDVLIDGLTADGDRLFLAAILEA